jgi:hypothetical protein
VAGRALAGSNHRWRVEDRYVSVDSFLEQLSSEGHKDSEGRFTLSLEHAREKLSTYLLESTEEYLLKLIQAGVAAGAKELELISKATHVKFVMHGVSLNAADLAEILNHLLQPSQSPDARALRHLATAVNTAVMTRAQGIVLATWDGSRGERFEWRSSGRTRSAWKPGGSNPRVLFQVRRTGFEFMANVYHLLSQRDILSMLLGTRAGMDPDRLLVLDRAAWCPVPLRLNGRWLPRPVSGPADAAQYLQKAVVLERSTADPGIRNFDRKLFTWPWSRNYQEPVAAMGAVGRQPTLLHLRSQMHWVLDGVEVGSTPIEGFPVHYFGWAVVSAHGCSTDLPGLRVKADAALESSAESTTRILRDLTGEPPPRPTPAPMVDRREAWNEARRRRARSRSSEET